MGERVARMLFIESFVGKKTVSIDILNAILPEQPGKRAIEMLAREISLHHKQAFDLVGHLIKQAVIAEQRVIGFVLDVSQFCWRQAGAVGQYHFDSIQGESPVVLRQDPWR